MKMAGRLEMVVCGLMMSCVLMTTLMTSCASGNTASTSGADEQLVKDAVAEFYSALNVMFTGDAAPMKAVWSHADDVNYMGPQGGLDVGWHTISKMWDGTAALKLGGKVEPVDIQLHVSHQLAVVCDVESGENTNANGETAKVSIRATNVFRKESGQWKMIGHHTDLLPYLAQ
jgi:ketosteroid isomerase-like protein